MSINVNNTIIMDEESENDKFKKRKRIENLLITTDPNNKEHSNSSATDDIIHRILPTTCDIDNDAKDYIEKCSYKFASMISCIVATNAQRTITQTSSSNTLPIHPHITGTSIIDAIGALGYKDYVLPLRQYLANEISIRTPSLVPTVLKSNSQNNSTKSSNTSINPNKPHITSGYAPPVIAINEKLKQSSIKDKHTTIYNNSSTTNTTSNTTKIEYLDIKDVQNNIYAKNIIPVYEPLTKEIIANVIAEFKMTKKSYIRKKELSAKYNINPTDVKKLFESYYQIKPPSESKKSKKSAPTTIITKPSSLINTSSIFKQCLDMNSHDTIIHTKQIDNNEINESNNILNTKEHITDIIPTNNNNSNDSTKNNTITDNNNNSDVVDKVRADVTLDLIAVNSHNSSNDVDYLKQRIENDYENSKIDIGSTVNIHSKEVNIEKFNLENIQK